MVVLVAMSNRARDEALEAERHAYDVTLLTRTLDASIARAEAALGRFVLDEDVKTQRQHLLQPVAARRTADRRSSNGSVAADPAQRARVDELQQLYEQRGERIRARRTGDRRPSRAGGTSYFYRGRAGRTRASALSAKLAEIASASASSLRERDRSKASSSRPRPTG